MRLRSPVLLTLGLAVVAAFGATAVHVGALHANAGIAPTKLAAAGIPTPAHVVVVMEENHSYADIIGNTSNAPYMNSLAGQGALITASFGVTHPSEPNYMALFAGSTVRPDQRQMPGQRGHRRRTSGSELLAAGRHVQGLLRRAAQRPARPRAPRVQYARKHSPWINFSNVPASDSLPFSCFPSDYASLPTVSFVIPNLNDDMHDGTINAGRHLAEQDNLSSYATWAKANNSLLIVTWDEDDYTENNQIPTTLRRRRGQGRPVQRDRSTTTTCSPRWSSCTACPGGLQCERRSDHRHLELIASPARSAPPDPGRSADGILPQTGGTPTAVGSGQSRVRPRNHAQVDRPQPHTATIRSTAVDERP